MLRQEFEGLTGFTAFENNHMQAVKLKSRKLKIQLRNSFCAIGYRYVIITITTNNTPLKHENRTKDQHLPTIIHMNFGFTERNFETSPQKTDGSIFTRKCHINWMSFGP